MFLIVGLGNPGKEYERTRHNLGFMVIDALADHYFSSSSFKEKFHGRYADGTIAGQKLVLLKPHTFMNRSGKSVLAAAQFYKIPPENIIVFHDDLDLVIGKVRVKINGGAAGHNGIRDLDQCLGKDYLRVRIGIHHPGDKNQVSDYVLGNLTAPEMDIMTPLIERLVREFALLYDKQYDLYMTRTMPIAPTSGLTSSSS